MHILRALFDYFSAIAFRVPSRGLPVDDNVIMLLRFFPEQIFVSFIAIKYYYVKNLGRSKTKIEMELLCKLLKANMFFFLLLYFQDTARPYFFVPFACTYQDLA